jgi:hypothetical protein
VPPDLLAGTAAARRPPPAAARRGKVVATASKTMAGAPAGFWSNLYDAAEKKAVAAKKKKREKKPEPEPEKAVPVPEIDLSLRAVAFIPGRLFPAAEERAFWKAHIYATRKKAAEFHVEFEDGTTAVYQRAEMIGFHEEYAAYLGEM